MCPQLNQFSSENIMNNQHKKSVQESQQNAENVPFPYGSSLFFRDSLIFFNHVCIFLPHHDCKYTCVAANDCWHDRCIDDPETCTPWTLNRASATALGPHPEGPFWLFQRGDRELKTYVASCASSRSRSLPTLRSRIWCVGNLGCLRDAASRRTAETPQSPIYYYCGNQLF